MCSWFEEVILCGFTGFLGGDVGDEKLLYHMSEKLVHLGPNDYGVWLDESAQIDLSHQRLSILDLSEAGHQPMISELESIPIFTALAPISLITESI